MKIVEFIKVEKSFSLKDIGGQKQRVLRGLSFVVNKGEILGLVGLNAQGKSTTIKIMLGLLFPDRGDVIVFDSYPGDLKIKKKISYLPENPVFFESLNAIEFLSFVGRLRGLDKKNLKSSIGTLIEKVGLTGNEKKPIRKYSKGMLQRLGLAQAFIGNPELVILDEPLNGLDPLGRKMARDLIIEANKEGSTIFFTSHILEDIEKICSRVGILHKGELLKIVEAPELQEKPLEDIFLGVIEQQ